MTNPRRASLAGRDIGVDAFAAQLLINRRLAHGAHRRDRVPEGDIDTLCTDCGYSRTREIAPIPRRSLYVATYALAENSPDLQVFVTFDRFPTTKIKAILLNRALGTKPRQHKTELKVLGKGLA